MLDGMSEEASKLSASQEPRQPHLHRHHRRRRFRIRPEALGEGDGNYTAMPVMTGPLSGSATATETTPEPARTAEPEPEEVSEEAIAHRTARKGMRICLVILVLVFVCTHYREIWKLCLSATLAWPDWLHDWHYARFWPF